MAARHEEVEESQENQNPQQKFNDHHHYFKIFSSYLGLSFSLFLGFLPKDVIPLLSSLLSKNKALTFKLIQAEQQLDQLRSRRKEDSKANARVAEIFASHRHGWQQEEKRLLQQIDECNQEISYLKNKVEDLERLETELKTNVEDLKREISERDEMINFMSRSYDTDIGSGFSSDFLNSAASKLWSTNVTSLQDVQYQPQESTYHLKHFVARRESPWQDDGVSNGVSSKLKGLEQELLNMERFHASEVQLQMHKQARRYQALAAKIDNLCDRMKASDPNEANLSSEFQPQKQTEFLLEAFRLQQRASEINDKLTALQTEAKPSTKNSLDSVRNNFKEIQRSLEIWLARIIGDLEGSMAKDGASRSREYYPPRYPYVQS